MYVILTQSQVPIWEKYAHHTGSYEGLITDDWQRRQSMFCLTPRILWKTLNNNWFLVTYLIRDR